MSENDHYAIAIDGPAASGKSTIAKCLARELGLVMVNSGAMYRAVTWKMLELGVDIHNADSVVAALRAMQVECGVEGCFSTIAIDGRWLSEELRASAVNQAVSVVAAVPEVRELLVQKQRDYLKHTSVVMEGRDIGSVVFPDTRYKIYVDASEEVRAARRSAEGVTDSVAARDKADSNRKTAPLLIAPGAVVLDNSHHTVESAVAAALEILRTQGLTKK
ncbi:MAG: (d)CMP kinase [Verrucomicrobia bacterium]|jgi:cytidylate kinase|nr:MAG: (d)CMP kinase [Verrucomicrobiota bacterium]